MQIRKKYIRLTAFLVFMATFALIIFIITDRNDHRLKRNARVALGIVDDVTSLRGSPLQANYSFVVNHDTIHNRRSINVDVSLGYLRNALTGKKLVVVYDSSDYSNNNLLLSVRDYREFGLEPDQTVLQVFKRIDSFRIGKDAMQ